MKILLVVSNAKKWPLNIPDCEVVAARKYLTEPVFSHLTGVRVFNLMCPCRYQSQGYYVSLLAEARGHKPVPNITTLRDLYTPAMVRMTSAALQDSIQSSLQGIKSDRFELSLYFGRNLAKRYDKLCRELFNRFHAHFLRAMFVRVKGQWTLQNISPISINEVPDSHYRFVEEAANDYFTHAGYRQRKLQTFRYSLAILHQPGEKMPPPMVQPSRSSSRPVTNWAWTFSSSPRTTSVVCRSSMPSSFARPLMSTTTPSASPVMPRPTVRW